MLHPGRHSPPRRVLEQDMSISPRLTVQKEKAMSGSRLIMATGNVLQCSSWHPEVATELRSLRAALGVATAASRPIGCYRATGERSQQRQMWAGIPRKKKKKVTRPSPPWGVGRGTSPQVFPIPKGKQERWAKRVLLYPCPQDVETT